MIDYHLPSMNKLQPKRVLKKEFVAEKLEAESKAFFLNRQQNDDGKESQILKTN